MWFQNYLLESAVSGPWQFHSSLVTDQDPIEIARMCVWEKMLDHLPEEIPYQIKIVSGIGTCTMDQIQ